MWIAVFFEILATYNAEGYSAKTIRKISTITWISSLLHLRRLDHIHVLRRLSTMVFTFRIRDWFPMERNAETDWSVFGSHVYYYLFVLVIRGWEFVWRLHNCIYILTFESFNVVFTYNIICLIYKAVLLALLILAGLE